VEQNNKTALKYLQQAASQRASQYCKPFAVLGLFLNPMHHPFFPFLADHPYAQALLGYMHLHGMGVERNVKEAVSYFWKSAEQGNSDGILHLANCYFCKPPPPPSTHTMRRKRDDLRGVCSIPECVPEYHRW
jgi:TPR repeat protein